MRRPPSLERVKLQKLTSLGLEAICCTQSPWLRMSHLGFCLGLLMKLHCFELPMLLFESTGTQEFEHLTWSQMVAQKASFCRACSHCHSHRAWQYALEPAEYLQWMPCLQSRGLLLGCIRLLVLLCIVLMLMLILMLLLQRCIWMWNGTAG